MHPIILGLWPIAGITSGPVAKEVGQATIQTAIDAGVDTIDTAYSYGYEGQSDKLLGEVLSRAANRDQSIRIIGKVGQRWTADKRRVVDCTPAQLTRDAEESLRRIGIAKFDWLMLHAVDPRVDIERSAEAIHAFRERGLADRVGVCNVTADQLSRFCRVGPCAALQCPLNLLQPDSLNPLICSAAEQGVAAHVYWTLMKGLLAGKIGREHVFEEGDSRPKYDIFQGQSRSLAHDAVDRLQIIAEETGSTVAKLALGWALAQHGVTAVLVGAKRPEQIRETVTACRLSPDLVARVEAAAEPYWRCATEYRSGSA